MFEAYKNVSENKDEIAKPKSKRKLINYFVISDNKKIKTKSKGK